MRRKIFTALLLIVLTGIPGCSGGTQTCLITGLTPDRTYEYGYEDSNGNVVTGQFRASGSTFEIPNVDNSVNCADIGVVNARIDLIAEGPVV